MFKKLTAALVVFALLVTGTFAELPFGIGVKLLAIRSYATSGDFTYTLSNGNATITGYSGSVADLIIPGELDGNPVVAIGNNAFQGNTNIITAVLPDSVLTIGRLAFNNCTNLQSIELNDGLTTIGVGAFLRCTSLIEVVIPDSVTTIESSAPVFVPQPVGATSHPHGTFQGCTSLSSITLGNGLTEIQLFTFADCTALTTINWGDSITTIGVNAFSNTGIEELYIPDSVTSLAGGAFEGNRELTTLVIGDGLTEIQGGDFRGNTSLISVILGSNIGTIGANVFAGCTNLRNITLNDGLLSIGNEAFRNTALERIDIPDSVTAIGIESFAWNENLVEAVIGDGVQAIPDRAFCYSPLLESVIIGSSVTSIGQNAFERCESLVEIVIPSNIKTIGRRAFLNCISLKSVTFNEGLEFIGEAAFLNCSALEELHIPDSVTVIESRGAEIITLPLGGYMTVPNGTFQNCTSLINVTLGSGITEIQAATFAGCTSLETINIGNFVNTIGGAAFSNTTALTSIRIPGSVTTIGRGAFDSSGLKALHLPRSVKTIDWGAFANNSDLSLVVLNSVETIEGNAFRNNTSLRTISWGDSLTFIGESAFRGNTSLQAVEFPPSLRDLGFHAFDDCTQLTSASISHNVRFGAGQPFGEMSRRTIFNNTAADFTIFGFWASTADEFATELGHNFESWDDFLTLDISALTNVATVNISGAAPRGMEVKIFVNNILFNTLTSGISRRYSGTVTLNNFGTHTIRAELITEDDDIITATKIIFYDENAPVLTHFFHHHTGQTTNLITDDGKPEMFIFTQHMPFTFVIGIENNEHVAGVYVVSERRGEEKLMKAVYDEARNIYIAQGFFDPDNTWYVPGNISVRYIPEVDFLIRSDVSFDFNHPIDIDLIANSLPPMWANAQYDILEEEPNRAVVKTTLEDETYLVTEFSTETIESVSVNRLLSEGFVPITDINGKTIYSQITIGDDYLLFECYVPNETQSLTRARNLDDFWLFDCTLNIIYSSTTNTYTDKNTNEWHIANFNDGYITQNIDEVALIFDVVGFDGDSFKDAITQMSNYSKMVYDNPNLSFEERTTALLALHAPVMNSMIAGNVAGIFFNNPVIELFTQSIGVLSFFYATSQRKAKREARDTINDLRRRGFNAVVEEVGVIDGKKVFAIAIIDPAGYVYEAVPSNRLPGVTVTVFGKDFGDDLSTLGDPWDASEFNQRNPLITDFEGRYAWDVPEGMWRVKAELDDFETAFSEWMPVPPPQLNVNIGMINRAAPLVKNINAYPTGVEIMFSRYMEIPTLTTNNITITDSSGNPVSGSILLINEESSYDPTSEYVTYFKTTFASIIRFIPDDEIEGDITVNISTDVESYAGTNMLEAFSEIVTVKLEPEDITADDVQLGYDGSGEVLVALEPAEAVAGMTLTAVSDNPFIVSVPDSVIIDENGNAVVEVTGNLPGSAIITLKLEGTLFQTEVTITVGMPRFGNDDDDDCDEDYNCECEKCKKDDDKCGEDCDCEDCKDDDYKCGEDCYCEDCKEDDDDDKCLEDCDCEDCKEDDDKCPEDCDCEDCKDDDDKCGEDCDCEDCKEDDDGKCLEDCDCEDCKNDDDDKCGEDCDCEDCKDDDKCGEDCDCEDCKEDDDGKCGEDCNCEDCKKDDDDKCPEDCDCEDCALVVAVCVPCTRANCGRCTVANCTAPGHVACPGHSSGSNSGGGGGGGGGSSATTETPTVQPVTAIATPTNVARAITALGISSDIPAAMVRFTVTGRQNISIGEDYAGQNAILARFNIETNELEFVAVSTVGANGSASLNIAQAGDYLVLTFKTGDITGTGEVQTTDALALLRHVAGISELNSIQQFVANGKPGEINTSDALNILRYVAGIIDKI
jgi:hypothetical protein